MRCWDNIWAWLYRSPTWSLPHLTYSFGVYIFCNFCKAVLHFLISPFYISLFFFFTMDLTLNVSETGNHCFKRFSSVLLILLGSVFCLFIYFLFIWSLIFIIVRSLTCNYALLIPFGSTFYSNIYYPCFWISNIIYI